MYSDLPIRFPQINLKVIESICENEKTLFQRVASYQNKNQAKAAAEIAKTATLISWAESIKLEAFALSVSTLICFVSCFLLSIAWGNLFLLVLWQQNLLHKI